MSHAMDTMTGGMVAWMLIWTVLAVGLLALVLGWLVRHQLERTTNRQPAVASTAYDAPLELLRRRYAAGEIDEDDYLLRLSGLSQH